MEARPKIRDTEGKQLNRMASGSCELTSVLPGTSFRRIPQFLTLLIWVLLAGSGCRLAPEHYLRVGTSINPGHEYLYLARSMGCYNNLGIRLIELPSDSSVLRAFRNKLIDAAALTMDEALLLEAQGHHPRVVLILNRSYGGNSILTQPHITSFQELKNRRVGVESTAMGAYILSRAMELGGLQPADIKIASLEVSEHAEAFRKKEIDAVVTSDPVRSELIAAGAHPLFDSALIPNEIVHVLVIREEALMTHQHELQGLVHAWFTARKHLYEHPLTAAQEMAPRTGMDPADLLAAIRKLDSPTKNENNQLLSHNNSQFSRDLARLADTMFQRGLLPGSVNAPSLLTDELVRKDKE